MVVVVVVVVVVIVVVVVLYPRLFKYEFRWPCHRVSHHASPARALELSSFR